MVDKRKNMRAFTKTNLDVPLNGELPPVTRKNIIRKKGRLSIHGDLEKVPMTTVLLIVQIRGNLL